MLFTLRLQGHTFALTGRFSDMTRDALTDHITARGGEVCALVTDPRVDALLLGEHPGAALELARAHGVPVVEGDALEALLDGEEIPRPTPPPPTRDAEALVALRGLLHGDDVDEVTLWPQLIARLDQCPPAQLEAAVHYVEAALAHREARRPGPALARHDLGVWKATPAALRIPGPPAWARVQLSMHLSRLAPRAWIGALNDHSPSPKLRLITSLSLAGARLTTQQIATAVSHPDLTGARELYLGEHCSHDGGTFESICDNPALQGVERLSLHHDATGMQHASVLNRYGDEGLPRVRFLGLHELHQPPGKRPALVLGYGAWGQRITTLWMTGYTHSPTALHDAWRDPAWFPNLERLLLDMTPGPGPTHWLHPDRLEDQRLPNPSGAALSLAQRVRVFGVAGASSLIALGEALETYGLLDALAGLEVVDLSALFTERWGPDTLDDAAELWPRVARSPLVQRVGVVWLGSMHDRPEIREVMRGTGVRVLDEPLACLRV